MDVITEKFETSVYFIQSNLYVSC